MGWKKTLTHLCTTRVFLLPNTTATHAKSNTTEQRLLFLEYNFKKDIERKTTQNDKATYLFFSASKGANDLFRPDSHIQYYDTLNNDTRKEKQQQVPQAEPKIDATTHHKR